MSTENKTLKSFYYDLETKIYHAVFEDGHIDKGVTSEPLVDDMATISIEGRIVINLHRNEYGYDVNYYYDVEEGSETSVYDGQDYHCDVTITQ